MFNYIHVNFPRLLIFTVIAYEGLDNIADVDYNMCIALSIAYLTMIPYKEWLVPSPVWASGTVSVSLVPKFHTTQHSRYHRRVYAISLPN